MLVAIEAMVIALIIAFFNNLGYNRGSLEISASDEVEIEVNRCVIKIVDLDKKDDMDLNYLTRISIPSSIDGDILMTYSFPDRNPVE